MRERSFGPYPLKCFFEDCCGLSSSPRSPRIVRRGYYFRKDDSKWIPRFLCLSCGRSFSSSRQTACFGQKKRTVNSTIEVLSSSGLSQRRLAFILRINRKTLVRKLLFLGKEARAERILLLASFQEKKIETIQFDEMETFERSKCLPLSIPLVVQPETRKILGFRIAEMPANGPLAQISRQKYGLRKDERAERARELFQEVQSAISENCVITTDKNPRYPGWLKETFSTHVHCTVKGRRGCVVGQGELKKIGFDPLFSLNHTCAMIRANVNRLFRRTWCTTKRRDRLAAHLEIYIRFHNQVLTA